MLNENIKSLRLARGINQVELAKVLGVTKQTISNWENNNIQPSIEMLVSLADYFGTSTDYLLGRNKINMVDLEGLPSDVHQHIIQIINDIKKASTQ